MKSRKLLPLVAVLIIASLVLAACPQPEPAEPQIVEKIVEVVQTVEVVKEVVTEKEVEVEKVVEKIVEVVATPEPMAEIDRNGAWLDTVVILEEPSADAAVSRLEVGDIDVYAFTVSNPEVAAKVAASPQLQSKRSSGSYNELSFNPVGPVWESTGKLNPFAVPAVREAMNWLIDRNYIVQEIMGGLATPRWTAFNNASSDYALMAGEIRALEAKYAYDPEQAEAVISAEMEALGATKGADDKWQYEGAPVEISVLIRTEDERRIIGDYVATQMENIGFTAIRDYKTAAEASPIWINGNPADGLFHIYTGGWISTQVPRDLGDNFGFFYTPTGLNSPLWQAYTPTEEFSAVADKLYNQLYTSVEERTAMMAEALPLSLEDSVRVWLVDRAAIAPLRNEINVASDLYGSIAGTPLWATTMNRNGEPGGSVRIAMPSILTSPWNPIAGSNWIYDAMLYRGMTDYEVVPDPYTGLNLPNRVERAELIVEEGRPVGTNLDWVDLQFVPSIEVPGDAWADWDAENQVFITASEAYTQPVTVARKSVVYYPADLYDVSKWHDGSPISAGDFVMNMILTFDRAKEASAIYDPAAVSTLNSFLAAFRGVKILSTDPLVIETYSDSLLLDAEMNINAWWPRYGFGPGAWHTLMPAIRAEAAGEAVFSTAKADTLEVDQISTIAGPTIAIQKAQLDTAQEEGFIPYEPTLGQFISAEEAEARYVNLQEWFRRTGHFFVGNGVFYLERAFPVEGTVIMQRFLDHPDAADKWAGFSAPPIAEVDLDGPSRVTIGDEASFDVFVEFEGEPYAVADISQVKYLLFDANGALAEVGEATVVEDGLWQITLSADTTGSLVAGSNRLEAIVISKLVALPSFTDIQFVTAQ